MPEVLQVFAARMFDNVTHAVLTRGGDLYGCLVRFAVEMRALKTATKCCVQTFNRQPNAEPRHTPDQLLDQMPS
jgi:hypothetical protein